MELCLDGEEEMMVVLFKHRGSHSNVKLRGVSNKKIAQTPQAPVVLPLRMPHPRDGQFNFQKFVTRDTRDLAIFNKIPQQWRK